MPTLTPGSIDPTGMSGRVSGWLRGAGTYPVSPFDLLRCFVIQTLDPDLYRFDLQSSTLPPGSNDLIQAFQVVSAWLRNPTAFQVSHFDFSCCFDLYRFDLDPITSTMPSNISIWTFRSVCRWLHRSGTFQVSCFVVLGLFIIDALDLDVYRFNLDLIASMAGSNGPIQAL